jgi:hypothetical protein
MKAPTFLLAACLALPVASFAQEKDNPSLADVARKTRKDQEKKKKTSGTPGTAKVYTEDDLRTAHGNASVVEDSSAPAAGATASAGEAGSASKAPTDAELREQKRASLQAQLDAQADFIKRLREAADANQSELNDLSNYLFGGRRANLARAVDERNQQIAQAEQAIADLEEQARRAGVALRRP